MKRILITGAAGFIGQYLAKQATKSGYDVVATDLAFPQADDGTYERRTGDLLDPIFSRELVKDIDYIVHLAAISRAGEAESAPLTCLRVNTLGTATLLDACLNVKVSPGVILGSTREVEQNFATNGVTDGIYGVSKKSAESIAEYYCHRGGMSLNIVRLSDVYGQATDTPGKVLSIFARNALQDKPLIVQQPEATFYFTHIRDICTALLQIISKNNSQDVKKMIRRHQLWPTQGIKLIELAELIRKITKSNSQIIIETPNEDKDSALKRAAYSKEKPLTKQHVFSISLQEGIQELISSMQT